MIFLCFFFFFGGGEAKTNIYQYAHYYFSTIFFLVTVAHQASLVGPLFCNNSIKQLKFAM